MQKVRCLFRLSPDEEKALYNELFPVKPMNGGCQYFGLHGENMKNPFGQKENLNLFPLEELTDIELYRSNQRNVFLKTINEQI